MTDKTEYRFRIDAYTPATLPMKRLAEYMLELAQLLGEPEHVHFREVAEGSAELVQAVDFVAVPKVRDRLRSSIGAEAPADLARRLARIDDMLASDNATGMLREVGHQTLVIPFRGRDRLAMEIGPVSETGSIQGQLIRIGGRDETAHAAIENGDRVHLCELPRELARALAPYLYGSPVRLTGRGRWRRTAQGTWEPVAFRAESFEPLESEGLATSIARLRAANADGRLIEPGTGADDLLEFRRER